MCLGIPQEIISINGDKATVKYVDRIKEATIIDLPVKVGDYVYVQADIIIAVIDKEEAELRIKALEEYTCE